MEHYPMADGAVMDGPEWGYEIAPFHQRGRSSIFHDLTPAMAEGPSAWATPTPASSRPASASPSACTASPTARCASGAVGAGGFLGAFGLLGNDPGLAEWLAFRMDALTETYARVREIAQGGARRPIRVAAGPRSAAFSGLCGYDYARLSDCLDLVLPKHYFWHRGFDGMYGTVARYVQTLCEWNAGLSERGALQVVRALFGIELPGDRHPERLRPRVPPGVLRPDSGAGDGAGPRRVRRPGAGLPLGGRRA